MNKKVIPIPIYDQDLIVYLYTDEEFEQLKKSLYEYEIFLDDNYTLGAVTAKEETNEIITWIDSEQDNILMVISHESVHLAGKVFKIIGDSDGEMWHTEAFAYLVGWMFQTILDMLPEDKITNRKVA